MKYKIVGIFNILAGLLACLLSFWLLFIIFRILDIFKDFNTNVNNNLTISYLLVLIIFITGIINLFLGIKLFTKLKVKYLKFGLIALVISFLGSGVLYIGAILSAVFPLYNLTTPIE